MSVARLTAKNLDVVFSGETGIVLDNEELIFKAKKQKNVYVIRTKRVELEVE